MSERYFPGTSETVKKWSGIGLLFLAAFLLIPILVTHWANWWACFIALPAIFLICLGSILAERSRKLHIGSRAIIAAGLVIAAVALMFLLELNWGLFWPVMLIVPSAGLLAVSLPFSRNWIAALYQEWLFYVSLSALLLGFEFLLANLGFLPLYSLSFAWWSLNLFAIFAGGLIITLRLFMAKRPIVAVLSNLLMASYLGFVGLVSFFSLDWNLLTPLYLISLGLILLLSCLFPQSRKNKGS